MKRRRSKSDRERSELIGERVARLRREHGLTQVELAEKLGIGQSLMSAYELGRFRLQSDLLVKLAEVLRVTSDELLGLEPVKSNGRTKNRRLARKLQQIDDLPPRDQQAILRVLDAVLAGRLSEPSKGASHARG